MKISVLQFSPSCDKLQNIKIVEVLIERVVKTDVTNLVVLPEVWSCLGGTLEQKLQAAESIPPVGSISGGGAAVQALRRIAKSHKIYVHGGSIIELSGESLLNTTIVVSPDGAIVSRYSKIHLFDVIAPSGQRYCESDIYSAGNQIVTFPVENAFSQICVGLAICYDLRFGELFQKLRLQGANLILLPAAFTVETGVAHWETLIRARAIETQCWFAAAGTVGSHLDAQGETRMTYGHSMIVDPWGTVVARTPTGEGFSTATIDHLLTEQVRARMPIQEHRRLL